MSFRARSLVCLLLQNGISSSPTSSLYGDSLRNKLKKHFVCCLRLRKKSPRTREEADQVCNESEILFLWLLEFESRLITQEFF